MPHVVGSLLLSPRASSIGAFAVCLLKTGVCLLWPGILLQSAMESSFGPSKDGHPQGPVAGAVQGESPQSPAATMCADSPLLLLPALGTRGVLLVPARVSACSCQRLLCTSTWLCLRCQLQTSRWGSPMEVSAVMQCSS